MYNEVTHNEEVDEVVKHDKVKYEKKNIVQKIVENDKKYMYRIVDGTKRKYNYNQKVFEEQKIFTLE
jgi:hypothetical protein